MSLEKPNKQLTTNHIKETSEKNHCLTRFQAFELLVSTGRSTVTLFEKKTSLQGCKVWKIARS